MKPPRNGTGRLSCLLNGKDLGAFQSWEDLAGKTVRKNVMTPHWPRKMSPLPEANAQTVLSSAIQALSDRALAKMTHILTSSSHSASRGA